MNGGLYFDSHCLNLYPDSALFLDPLASWKLAKDVTMYFLCNKVYFVLFP